jgi:hypothetical protein
MSLPAFGDLALSPKSVPARPISNEQPRVPSKKRQTLGDNKRGYAG